MNGSVAYVRRVLIALCLTSLVLVAVVTVAGSPGPTQAVTHQEANATQPELEPVTLPPDETPPPAAAVSTAVPAALPMCAVADEPALASGYDDWRLTLLDTRFALPETYQPPDLVALTAAFPAGSADSAAGLLRALVIEDLRAMVSDAAAAGHQLAVQSAYRDYRYQADTFQYWVDRQGHDSAVSTSARAGHSEHQLGTALDLRSLLGPAAWDLADWATTPEGAWVAANSWRYGFVMSYPAGKQDLSCYSYEPWHYRYFGRQLAAEIQSSGLTAREVLWSLSQTAARTAARTAAQTASQPVAQAAAQSAAHTAAPGKPR